LAVDISKISQQKPIEKPKVDLNIKPTDSEFECFGCGS
jgi:hypothetical protein